MYMCAEHVQTSCLDAARTSKLLDTMFTQCYYNTLHLHSEVKMMLQRTTKSRIIIAMGDRWTRLELAWVSDYSIRIMNHN